MLFDIAADLAGFFPALHDIISNKESELQEHTSRRTFEYGEQK